MKTHFMTFAVYYLYLKAFVLGKLLCKHSLHSLLCEVLKRMNAALHYMYKEDTL